MPTTNEKSTYSVGKVTCLKRDVEEHWSAAFQPVMFENTVSKKNGGKTLSSFKVQVGNILLEVCDGNSRFHRRCFTLGAFG